MTYLELLKAQTAISERMNEIAELEHQVILAQANTYLDKLKSDISEREKADKRFEDRKQLIAQANMAIIESERKEDGFISELRDLLAKYNYGDYVLNIHESTMEYQRMIDEYKKRQVD